ncbi:MAG TPA: ABC transporter permease [Epulopiscium sp.]|jgi:simple sugar transport system permease protein|nr:ABC transporter permease [Candidatus Epulonipiscium sp.]
MEPNLNVNKRKPQFSLMDFLTKWGTVITVIFLFVLFSVLMPRTFLTASNMITILRSISIVTVIAIGVTISLTVNGFDLSVGSTATFADALIMTMFIWYGMPTSISIVLTIIIALSIACINSFFIVKVKIPDMLVTLASMFVFQGVAMTYSGGGSVSENMARLDGTPTTGKVPDIFDKIGQAPWIIIIMLVVVISVHIFLTYTKHGRYLYTVGGNLEAARLSGIPVNRYRTLAYFMSTFFATLGGIMLASRVGSAQINAGAGYLMPAVAAAYIGFSVAGAGKPNAIGTLIGALLVGILENGLVMLSVPYYSLDIVKGTVLMLALASTYFRSKD